MHLCLCGIYSVGKIDIFDSNLENRVIECIHEECEYNEVVELTLSILRRVSEIHRDKIYVMFSGGKDSLVLLHLAVNHLDNEVEALFIEVTGNTHEELEEYVYRVCSKLGVRVRMLRRDDMEFWDRVKHWGWPGPRRRWCMTEFKRRPIEQFFSTEADSNVVFVGVKARDSPRRKDYIAKDRIAFRSPWRTIVVRPLIHWTTKHIMKYIEEHGLELNPLYKILGESGSCVYCPYIMKPEYYAKLRSLYPHWFQKIIEAEQVVKKGTPFISGPRKYRVEDLLLKLYSRSETRSVNDYSC